jgi:2,5-diamino-6-(ribosylamino)-4(3H)-pyrimidinone 5'-phosphate reductase
MNRPFVYMNMAMTVDGKITSAKREYADFTSDLDRKNMDRLRAEADAVLIGAGTLRSDDPPLGIRDPEMRKYRQDLGKPEHLPRIVITATGDLNLSCAFFRTDGPPPMVVTVEDLDRGRLERLRKHAEVVRFGSSSVDLAGFMAFLGSKGIRRLLVEGGGELNWEMLRIALVDEIFVTVAPALLGGREAPTLLEGKGWSLQERCSLELLDVRREADELFCRYRVSRP